MKPRSDMEVMEILGQTRGGHTEPYLCRLDDDKLYVVKGRGATWKGLIAEVCCAWLGQKIGLPVPDYTIATIPSALLRHSDFSGVESSLGGEFVFASSYQHFTDALTPALLPHVDKRLLAQIYAFDHWIANGDRTLGPEDGNPNLLVRLSDHSELIVYDHNLAFASNHSIDELDLHVGKGSWNSMQGTPSFIDELLSKMSIALNEFHQSVDQLPDVWLEQADTNLVDEMTDRLRRIYIADFWGELG